MACDRCKLQHRKCLIGAGSSCIRCTQLGLECKWRHKEKPCTESSLFDNDKMYANAIRQRKIDRQYVTSTQPLAPLLSRDWFFCFDGGDLGFYFPWRDSYFTSDSKDDKLDPDLKRYLVKKGAFVLPSEEEQNRLLQLYLSNVYPLYPVVDRDILEKISEIPAILLNALMLTAVRYDEANIETSQIREKAQELFLRCQLLEMAETNQITLIQAYLLMSMHEEGPKGSLNARRYVSRAIILAHEIGLHNFSIQKNDNAEYSSEMLRRLFWTSFCCDRAIAATSNSAMMYNRLDMIIDEPSVKDFDSNIDYEIFNKWYSLCSLYENVLIAGYRPPPNRSTVQLEEKLHEWEMNLRPGMEEKFSSFFKVAYSYCFMLYLRCGIDFLVLLNDEREAKQVVNQLTRFYNLTLDNAPFAIQHIVVIHAVLHTSVLLLLELTAKMPLDDVPSEQLRSKQQMLDSCMQFLQSSKYKWWLPSASYYLLKEISGSSQQQDPRSVLGALLN